MNRNKYPISREFFPLSLYTPKMSIAGIRRANRLNAMTSQIMELLRIEYMKRKFG